MSFAEILAGADAVLADPQAEVGARVQAMRDLVRVTRHCEGALIAAVPVLHDQFTGMELARACGDGTPDDTTVVQAMDSALRSVQTELALACTISPRRARARCVTALAHSEHPGLLATVTDGRVNLETADMLLTGVSVLDRHRDQAQVVRDMLPGLQGKPVRQVDKEVRAKVQGIDPRAAAKRHRDTVRKRRLALDQRNDSVADLKVLGYPTDLAAEAYNAIHHAARQARAGGDTRSLDQLTADIAIARLTGSARSVPCDPHDGAEHATPGDPLIPGADPATAHVPETYGNAPETAGNESGQAPTGPSTEDPLIPQQRRPDPTPATRSPAPSTDQQAPTPPADRHPADLLSRWFSLPPDPDIPGNRPVHIHPRPGCDCETGSPCLCGCGLSYATGDELWWLTRPDDDEWSPEPTEPDPYGWTPRPAPTENELATQDRALDRALWRTRAEVCPDAELDRPPETDQECLPPSPELTEPELAEPATTVGCCSACGCTGAHIRNGSPGPTVVLTIPLDRALLLTTPGTDPDTAHIPTEHGPTEHSPTTHNQEGGGHDIVSRQPAMLDGREPILDALAQRLLTTRLAHAAKDSDRSDSGARIAITDTQGRLVGYHALDTRTFRGLQREAQAVDQQWCAFPTCTTSALRCQADHTIPYNQIHQTTPDNITMLCGADHASKSHSGYTISRITGPDGTSTPVSTITPAHWQLRTRSGQIYMTAPPRLTDPEPPPSPPTTTDHQQPAPAPF